MKATLLIPKMKCEGCVSAIKEALSKVKRIGEFSVDLARKEVTVETGGATLDAIKEVLTGVGYPPAN
jgi:copper chaperone